VRFEWSPEKAAANLAKHKVSFDEASTVFGDPLAVTIDDPDTSTDENRLLTKGMSQRWKLLVVVAHTYEGGVIRIISARRATKNERRQYESEN